MSKNNTVKQLTDYGFKPVGEWIWNNKKPGQITFNINEEALDKTELIYAFTIGDTVRYIGVTTTSLKKRMNGYKNAPEPKDGANKKGLPTTNIKLRKFIIQELKNKNIVKIQILCEQSLCLYQGLKISLVSGIEHSLIDAFNEGDLLNERGVKTTKEKNKSIIDKPYSNLGEFNLSLGKEYYLKGKVAFPLACNSLLPQGSGVPVKIKLLGEDEPIDGTFTRSGTTLAINGKVGLQIWYKKNFSQGDKIGVRITDETHFELFRVSEQ
jgi:hypothetical protein